LAACKRFELLFFNTSKNTIKKPLLVDRTRSGHFVPKDWTIDPPVDRTRSGHFVPKDWNIDGKEKTNDPANRGSVKPDEPNLEMYQHPTMDQKKFVKAIRTPNGMYNQWYEAILRDFKENPAYSSSIASLQNQKLHEELTEAERAGLFDALLTNTLFPKTVSKYTEKVTKATMLFPNTIYQHMVAGLGNYCMNAMADHTGDESYRDDIKKSFRYVTYYRSGVICEELYRMGWDRDSMIRMVAKEHFLQYWHGKLFPNFSSTVFWTL